MAQWTAQCAKLSQRVGPNTLGKWCGDRHLATALHATPSDVPEAQANYRSSKLTVMGSFTETGVPPTWNGR